MNKFLKYIELNLSELCNYTCAFCPRGHGYPNVNVHMLPETADVIVQQIKDLNQPVTVQLAGRGEPTLNKYFGEILQKLLDLKEVAPVTLEMNTNGKWLDKYLPLVKQMDYVVYNVYAENPEDPKDIKKRYPEFTVKDKKDASSRNWKTRAGYIPDQINAEPEYSHPKYGGICHKPFEVVYIDWQGNYNLCCDVWKDIEVLGNIFNEPIKEYTTRNKRIMEYRSRLAQGKRDMNPCKDCNIQCSIEFLDKLRELTNENKQSSTGS
tara:strand:+ start:47 stop:841 length:795 start_codon:yes stop_codon:yes gene_type:complete